MRATLSSKCWLSRAVWLMGLGLGCVSCSITYNFDTAFTCTGASQCATGYRCYESHCAAVSKGAHCGDYVVDPGEQCDEGADNSDTLPDHCRTDCKLPSCSDPVRSTGEACYAPTVSVPALTNNPTPTWTWVSHAGDTNFRYGLDANALNDATASTSFTPTAPLADGNYTLYVEGRSAAGIYSGPGSAATQIDTIPPAAPVLVSVSTTLQPVWQWVSGGGGDGNYRVNLDANDMVHATPLPAGQTFYAAPSPLVNGTHTLYVQESDPAGNWSPVAALSTVVAVSASNGGLTETLGAQLGGPTTVVAGASEHVTVTLAQNGVTDASYVGTVSISSSDPNAVLPAAHVMSATDGGVYAFTGIVLKTAGAQVLTLSGDRVTEQQISVTVNPNVTSQFAVSTSASTAAGAALTVQVTAQDAYGNVTPTYERTVQVTSTDAQAVLPFNYTFQASDQGSAFVHVTLKSAGPQSITVADVNLPAITGTQAGIEVSYGALNHLGITARGWPATVGSAGSVVVTARDNFNNTLPTFTGTVHFTSTDSQSTLPSDYTYGASDAGSHTFSATLKTAGSMAIEVSTSGTAVAATTVQVNAGAASSMALSAVTASQTACTSNDLSVTLHDVYGNVASAYTGTVTLSSSDPNAVLPPAHTYTGFDAGAHTFNGMMFANAGIASITASDGTLSATQSNIMVSVASVTSVQLAVSPNTLTAGQAANVTVQLVDNCNLTVANTDAVQFVVTGCAAGSTCKVPANFSYALSDNGTKSFSAGLDSNVVGTLTLQARDSTASISAAAATVVVTHGPLGNYVTDLPSSLSVSNATAFSLHATDVFGNPVTGYTGTVIFASSDGSATLPPTYTFGSGENGVHAFSPGVTFATTGNQTLTMQDFSTGFASVQNITVLGGPASQVILSGLSATTDGGTPVALTLTVKDSAGNVANGFTGTLQLSSSDSSATYPMYVRFAASDQGVKTVTLMFNFNTTGTQTVTATETTNSFNNSISTTVKPHNVFGMCGGPVADHFCAIMNPNQAFKCWGNNNDGQLGLGDTIARGATAASMGSNLPYVNLGTGLNANYNLIAYANTGQTGMGCSSSTCVLLNTGRIKCWGNNASGQLGLGDTNNRGDNPGEMGDNLPTVSLGTQRTATALANGANFACALLDNSTVKCWGDNSYGQLGQGDNTARGASPTDMGDSLPVVSLNLTPTAITAGANHVCASGGGNIQCWGRNDHGQLGLGDTNNRGGHAGDMGANLPYVDLNAPSSSGLVVSAGNLHTCAIYFDGSSTVTVCWGNNAEGELGTGDFTDRGVGPNQMGANLTSNVQDNTQAAYEFLFSGTTSNYATTFNDAGYAWGGNSDGQLGTDDTVTVNSIGSPTHVPFSSAFYFAGINRFCTLNGGVKCWGNNSHGELGLGDTVSRGGNPNDMANLGYVPLW